MKLISTLLMLLMSVASLASETKTFVYDGSQDSMEMVLRSVKTHTEYSYEQRHTICYRQDVFYRRICRPSPQGTICQNIPEYRTVSYPCMQTVRVERQVKDYDVEAKVNLEVAALSSTLPAGEAFKVSLRGDEVTLTATGSKNFFILLKKEEVQSQMTGSLKLMTASYSAELVEAAPILKALEMTNIEINKNILSFTLGPVAVQEAIGFRLTVSKAPLLGSDTVLFNRELASSEVELKIAESNSIADVDIQKLGITLTSGRHLLTANAFYKYDGKLLNASQFEKTQAGRTLIYKLR